ncbi:MAG: phenylalanine--tRNA ligase subunit beta [Candidatus Hydrogenedentes bacterium]|nr:phenylalanine--tRNA ligase subunit beta [Candidatus Hydrogenedentota bacterium]
MRVSLNWLKEYVNLDGISVEDLAHRMTMLGLEIEAIEEPGAEIQQVYVGEILSIEPHPDADKIVVCKTNTGGPEALQICCGAKNMKVGDKVPTAIVGATLPGGFAIGRRKMRGIESEGMMCSGKELGLGDDHAGLLILPPDFPVGADAKPLLGLDDVIFEIEVTPNRGDWASMIGVARELAAYYNRPLSIPATPLNESAEAITGLTSVCIENPELCGRYLGRVMKNVQVGPSPQWLQSRLQAAGQRPINNVVDITNFVLLETGHPLHGFDYDLLAEHRIVVRAAKAGEKITTLDGQERPLATDMLVIADGAKTQCVAGIMGGSHSEVSENTTTVFLESAWFNPASVRKTSRALQLISESSQRFQRGADPEMAVYALERAAALMQEICGATVARGAIDQHPLPLPRKQVTLRHARCNALLGTPIDAEEQKDVLVRLGFSILVEDAASCTFHVPPRRHDVSMETDLIEEIARFHGYDRMDVSLPAVRPSAHVFAPQYQPERALRHFLIAQGLTEVFHWTFCNAQDAEKAGLAPALRDMVALENPLSEKQGTMRSSLLPGLLNHAAYNLNRGAASLAVFEVGPVYAPVWKNDLPTQELHLGMLLHGPSNGTHWSGAAKSYDFYDLKGLLEATLSHLGVDATFEPSTAGTFQPGQNASIVVGKQIVGTFGKVHLAVAKAFDIDPNLYLLELALDSLLSQAKPHGQFSAIPTFPPSKRDMAVVVDEAVPAGALAVAARAAGGSLLKSVELFDIYRSEGLGAGKKSVALNLSFQADDKTLTDNDTQKQWDKILKKLQTDYQATLR